MLNQRVTIQSQSATQDALGQPAQTWADVMTVWASIKHTSGLEAIKADTLTSTVKASIQIRFTTGITAGMRALSGAVSYNIVAVLPDVGGREYVNLVCEVVS